MEKKTLTLKEVILNAIRGNETTIYFADEDAVWKIDRLLWDINSSCGLSFCCKVSSVYGNRSKDGENQYHYGDTDDFIFSKNDIPRFFYKEEDAEVERASIIAKAMMEADWKE